MKVRFILAPAAVMILGACSSGAQSDDTGEIAWVAPETAACADAPQLRQQADEERRRITETSSDQARVVLASRANFLASFAVIADLQCAATDNNEATAALQAALQAARTADGTSGFYAQASQWAEANFAATRTIEILVQRRTATVRD